MGTYPSRGADDGRTDRGSGDDRRQSSHRFGLSKETSEVEHDEPQRWMAILQPLSRKNFTERILSGEETLDVLIVRERHVEMRKPQPQAEQKKKCCRKCVSALGYRRDKPK